MYLHAKIRLLRPTDLGPVARICLFVGIARKLRTMKAANAAGEEEVQKEIAKRAGCHSTINSTISTPETLPSTLCNSPEGVIQPFSLDPPTHQAHLNNPFPASPMKPEAPVHEMIKMNRASLRSSLDDFSKQSYV